MNKSDLLVRIKERKLSIGVIGLGYVGLLLAVESAKSGFKQLASMSNRIMWIAALYNNTPRQSSTPKT
jgi:hypothetical protein